MSAWGVAVLVTKRPKEEATGVGGLLPWSVFYTRWLFSLRRMADMAVAIPMRLGVVRRGKMQSQDTCDGK